MFPTVEVIASAFCDEVWKYPGQPSRAMHRACTAAGRTVSMTDGPDEIRRLAWNLARRHNFLHGEWDASYRHFYA